MDSSTKRTLLILGVIVLVLVALFVVAVVAAAHDGEPSGCSAERRRALRDRWLGSGSVKPGDLRGCTTSLGSFVVNGVCVLSIAPSDARSRRLVIESPVAMTLDITTDADGRKLTMHPELKPNKPTEISFGKDKQSIVFHCPSPSGCKVTLK